MRERATWDRVAATVHRYAPPGEPIFVALQDNRGHFASLPVFYWYADRPPVSRFIELDPCLTDTEAVQREIVMDLAGADVVIASAYFGRPPPFDPPVTLLDEYLAAHFQTRFSGGLLGDGDITVLVREATG